MPDQHDRRAALLGEANQLGELVVVAQERVHFEFPETAGKGDVLFGGEHLIAEEQHLVVDPRTGQFVEHLVGQRLRQIESLDDATERGAHLTHLEVLPLERCQPDALGRQMGDRTDDHLVRPEGELACVELADVAGWFDALQLRYR